MSDRSTIPTILGLPSSPSATTGKPLWVQLVSMATRSDTRATGCTVTTSFDMTSAAWNRFISASACEREGAGKVGEVTSSDRNCHHGWWVVPLYAAFNRAAAAS